MEMCLFCDCTLAPGSEEHVFLSSLGGRIATKRAVCLPCNNAFANEQTGKIDDALARAFEEVRNGLKIWTGRDRPPPTLLRAGALPNGMEFDLAPGFIPIVRPGKLPDHLEVGIEHTLNARDATDAKRQLSILGSRGFAVELDSTIRMQQKAPLVKRRISFDGPRVWRCVGKSAVVGFAVLYGNEQARAAISTELRKSIRYGTPDITNFAGWDFVNEWPNVSSLVPHSKTPQATTSGFEHSLLVADVGTASVGYVTLFGGWRFSVVLGPRTGLPARGVALNPRSSKPARFVVESDAPTSYAPRHASSFKAEHAKIRCGNQAAFDRAMERWSSESNEEYSADLYTELTDELVRTGDDEAQRADIIKRFAMKLATIEFGQSWEVDLGTIFDEDEAVLKAQGSSGSTT